jgi:hypothetical protein
MAMTDAPVNPTDAAICGLLATGPLPAAALAIRLGIPERTARHRLYRLRQAGTVVTDSERRHHLAAPMPAGSITGGSAALAAPAGDLAAPVLAASIAGALPPRDGTTTTASIAGGLPPRDTTAMPLAASVLAPDHPDHDGTSSRQVGGWRTGTVRAVIAVGVAVAGGIAIAVAIRRVAPPSPPLASPTPPRPLGFSYPGDPWGGMSWWPGDGQRRPECSGPRSR